MALVRSSEEDVYYRIDSMLLGIVSMALAKERDQMATGRGGKRTSKVD